VQRGLSGWPLDGVVEVGAPWRLTSGGPMAPRAMTDAEREALFKRLRGRLRPGERAAPRRVGNETRTAQED
jgi:hypothetical protein